MDFIQGQTLMERVKTQGKLSEAECLKYIRQIGSALEAVHQAGMVHRDAHPGNIMIQPNGNAILIDFGIAKEIIPAGSSSTDYAANPSFAPYEQVYKGSKANRQPSVDIYALAASFYYAVTGQKPTPSMERRLDNRPLTSPKEINPNLSDHLNKAITLGMALEKENRPQSMSDWLQQLELPPPPVEEKYRQEKVNPPQPRKEPKVAKTKASVNPKPSENSLQKKLKDIPWGWLIGVFLVYGLIGYTLAVSSARWQVWAGAVAAAVAGAAAVAWAAAVAVTWVATGAGVAAVAVAGAGAGVWAVPWAGAVVVAWAVAGAVAVAGVVAWAVAELLLYRRESTNQFAPFLLFVFPGLIGGITFSLMSGNVLGGVVTGIGSMVIVFTQCDTIYELEKKNFSPFNIFLILAVTNLSGLASGWLLAFLLHSKG
jgi:serine/threonine-protein kinase